LCSQVCKTTRNRQNEAWFVLGFTIRIHIIYQLALPFLAPWDFPIFSSPSAPHTCPQVAGLSAQLNEYRPRWPHLLLLQLLLHLEQYGAMTVFVSSWCQNLSRNVF